MQSERKIILSSVRRRLCSRHGLATLLFHRAVRNATLGVS